MNKLISLAITDLRLTPDRMSLSWTCGSQKIMRSYQFPIQSVNVLHDAQGVAVVESIQETGPRNAVILHRDGTERFRVLSPIPENLVRGFSDCYYVGEELTAILICVGRDFAVVVDESSGKCLRHYETR
jgi:hypothetical protein